LLEVAGQIVWAAGTPGGQTAFVEGSVASWVAELGFVLPPRGDRAALTKLGEELICRTGSVQVSVDSDAMLPTADVVVCCTSATEHIVREECLRHSAVVCDVSRPSNLSAQVAACRPDVTVLNGGVVRLPGGASLGFNTSLPPGHAYACMAETMMLAMEKRYEDMSLGFDLPLAQVLEMGRLADESDFQVILDHKVKGESESDGFRNVAENESFNTAYV
jgi:predicted amino acid dehydrogenase